MHVWLHVPVGWLSQRRGELSENCASVRVAHTYSTELVLSFRTRPPHNTAHSLSRTQEGPAQHKQTEGAAGWGAHVSDPHLHGRAGGLGRPHDDGRRERQSSSRSNKAHHCQRPCRRRMSSSKFARGAGAAATELIRQHKTTLIAPKLPRIVQRRPRRGSSPQGPPSTP